ncbi:MAG: hypothetical protein ACK417_05145 [Bacteroidia bacterium]
MKRIVILAILLGSFGETQAQKAQLESEVSLSAGSDEFALSLGGLRTHRLFKSEKWLLGYGLRYNLFAASNVDYITAPARLTLNDKLDTFNMAAPQLHMLNAYVMLGYQFHPRWSFEFDIDLLGLSFGGQKAGLFNSSEFPAFNGTHSANPTPLNVLLVGDNDLGSLSSNFRLHYRLNDSWGVRAGFNYFFTEYTTTMLLSEQNDRFRRKSGMFSLAVNRRF